MRGVPAPNRRISVPKPGPARVLSRPARSRGARATLLSGPHAVELAGLLHELSVRLLNAESFASGLERLAEFLVGAVPGTVRCSVALIGEGGPLTCTAAGPSGEGVDEIQYASSAGPGLDAARTRSLVTVADLTRDGRWPELAEPARAAGVRSVAAVPLDVPRAEVARSASICRRRAASGRTCCSPRWLWSTRPRCCSASCAAGTG